MRRYLLGQMAEVEEGRVERAYLGSDEALEELRAHEDELIEEYLANALEPSERERFERHFLASPARLERLIFIRALHDRMAPPPAAAGPPPANRRAPRASWLLIAASLVVVVVTGLLAVRALGPRAPAGQAPASIASPEGGAAISSPAAAAPVPSPTPGTVSLRLGLPALRGEAGEVPVLDPGPADRVVLEAPLDPRDAFPAHRGRVTAPDGRDAFLSPWQPNRGEATLRVVVPSASLRDGRHVLVVEGARGTGEEPVESYAFRVRRR